MTAQLGGGKYDPELGSALEATGAAVVLLVVIGGDRGDGFAVAVNEARLPAACVRAEIPSLLRALAESIDSAYRGQN